MVRPLVVAVSLFALLLLLVPLVIAVPPVATEFYGYITNKGAPISSGTIYANATDGTYCGRFTISVSGKYGLLSCLGDDPSTSAKEGVSGSGTVDFSLSDGTPLRAFGDNTWSFGQFKEVNLTTFAVCGDLYCDSLQNETCSSCPYDCGVCNLTNLTNLTNITNTTTNLTGNQTNGTGSSAGKGGTGGVGGAAGNGGAGGAGGASASSGSPQCKEQWQCGPWRPFVCPISETENRTCQDLNNCQTEKHKPPTTRPCRYKGTCYDGVTNNNETDIDCGGDLCPSCDLGQHCLRNSDCISDYCSPANLCALPPSPAPVVAHAKPPAISVPGLVVVCGNRIPWEVLIPLLLLSFLPRLLIDLYIKHYLPKHHRRYRTLSQEDKFRYQIKLRGRAFWLTIALLFVTAFVSFYAYLYIGCPDFVGLGLFFVIILAILVFYAIYLLMRYYEYHEERTHEQLTRLLDQHYSKLKHLIALEDAALLSIERELLSLLKDFVAGTEADLADARTKLSPLASVLTEVVAARAVGKPVADAEKKLGDAASPLLDDAALGNLADRSLPLKRVMSRLRLLADHYKNQEQLKTGK